MKQTYNCQIGIAPISWVNDDIPGLGDHYTQDQVLQEMAELGYVSTEMGRLFMQDPPRLKAKLEQYGIRLASKFVGTLFSDPDRLDSELHAFAQWVAYLNEMGSKHVIACEMGGSMHWDPRRAPGEKTVEKLTEAGWASLAEGLHRAAKLCQEQGMRLVYHYHAGTVVETAAEVDRLMELTDPALVHLLYDTGHALYGGYDPLQLLDKYAERIAYVHVKDVRAEVLQQVRQEQLDFRSAVLRGLFTVPGDGCIDFAPIFRKLKEMHYDGWIIVEAEQDPAIAHPYTYAQKAKAYLDATIEAVYRTGQEREAGT
ncbi:myo-inosose-2 dehydratase [Brevibacillus sp. TJ4]|uniref:myo-inosose-2 dehydratase n=1 Tax=Brevibacillus sp. TJ4 TaxID=3234853 RepID=UPI0037CCF640